MFWSVPDVCEHNRLVKSRRTKNQPRKRGTTYKSRETKNRLELKRGLFWYRHHPKIHDTGSDGSLRAEDWTTLRKSSMRVFCVSNIMHTNTIVGQQHAQMYFFVNQIFEKLLGPYQSGKKQFIRYNLIEFN